MHTAPSPAVIVVDDDEALRSAIVDLIRSLGYAAQAYCSADAFCGADRQPACACIITDIEMPGMDGFALIRYSARHYPGVPVIVISAVAARDLQGKALAAGACAVLQKPFSADELARYVTAAIATRAAG